jgi:hypothetical protein
MANAAPIIFPEQLRKGPKGVKFSDLLGIKENPTSQTPRHTKSHNCSLIGAMAIKQRSTS